MIKFLKKYKYASLVAAILVIVVVSGASWDYMQHRKKESWKTKTLQRGVDFLQGKGMFLELYPDGNRCVFPKIKKGGVVKMQQPKCIN